MADTNKNTEEIKTNTEAPVQQDAAAAGSSSKAPRKPKQDKPKQEKPKQQPKQQPKQDKKADKGAKELLGVGAKKEEDFSEWYTNAITRSEMIEYYDISGCYIMRPWAYSIWEQIQEFFNVEIKKLGVQNAYFPLLVSERALNAEKDHIEGFAPEVCAFSFFFLSHFLSLYFFFILVFNIFFISDFFYIFLYSFPRFLLFPNLFKSES